MSEGKQEPYWSLRGYQSESKPLYNLHLLKKFTNAKVLIVEGEKTCDAGNKLFSLDKMICLTWPGGAGAVSKADWSPLKGREVIIWPDNDKAGFDAADSVIEELQKVGVKSLRDLDRKLLTQELPPKWDLADSLPEGKSFGFLKDLVLRSRPIEIPVFEPCHKENEPQFIRQVFKEENIVMDR